MTRIRACARRENELMFGGCLDVRREDYLCMEKAEYGEENIPTGASSGLRWKTIDWDKAEKQVKRLQFRIAEAVHEGRWNKVMVLQRTLTRSHYARLLAVKRVSSSKGSRTPGIDGVVWNTPKKKWMAAESLVIRGYKAMPLRRVTIPKKNGKKRILGIPTMKDRAMQALFLLALEPVAETAADPNSYGFRPKRGCRDAIGQCHISLSKGYSPRWVLDADIKACFDGIDHDWLMENIPMDKKVLFQWLKCGFMDNKILFPTNAGTPQGGIISPLLANMALDGMEGRVKQFNKRGMKINFIRYADDFVVTAEHKETLTDIVLPEIKAFLADRGLKISGEKTRIVNIEDGFNFLGQNIRKYKGNKLIIKPSDESKRIFLNKVKETIAYSGGRSAEFLIKKLNPVIRGWGYYHRYVQSGKCFYDCQYWINGYLRHWAKRGHGNKTMGWLHNYFWGRYGHGRQFSCLGKAGGKTVPIRLVYPPDIRLARYIKIRGLANVYSKKDKKYFAMRDSRANLTLLESYRILPLAYKNW